MNELTVKKVTNGVISTNFAEFKNDLIKTLEDYKGLVVTEQNCSEMKETRKTLTASVKTINSKRLEIKKEFLLPLNAFEDDCKEAISLIEEVSTEIKDMTDVFDERIRQEKLDYAKESFEKLKLERESEGKGLNEKYLNRVELDRSMFTLVATSKKKILEDIKEQFSYLWTVQERELQNRTFVSTQIESVSSMLELAIPISINDVSHLISDYETLNTATFMAELTEIAKRRRDSEVEAVRLAKEKIEAEKKAAELKKIEEEKEEQARIELAKLKAEEERIESTKVVEHVEETIEDSIEEIIEDSLPEFSSTFVPLVDTESTYEIKVTCTEAEYHDLIHYIMSKGIEVE